MPALPQVDLVVVMPVGPNATREHILDTLDSVLVYAAPSRRIILADNSGKGMGQAVASEIAGVDVLTTARPHGTGGGLHLTLCRAYAHALEQCRFRALLRLDTDALVIGPAPEQLAMELFAANPRLAMGGEVYRNNVSVRARLDDAAGRAPTLARLRLALQRPWSRYRWRSLGADWMLGQLYKCAQAQGYASIDYVFGGCNFVSESFLLTLRAQGLLPEAKLGPLDLEEDHLFGLLAGVVGMGLADLHSGALPFGTAWKSLPASPADLIVQGKRVVHSTRGWQGMDEDAIRAEFRARRRRYAAETGHAARV